MNSLKKIITEIIMAEEKALQTYGIIPLNTITSVPVKWFWQGHIPLGKLTLFDGDPGLGKSHIALDLAARTSNGLSMPDGTQVPQGGAVFLTLEDGLADTIVPRLKAAGADLSKIVALQSVPDGEGNRRYPTVADIDAIGRACEMVQAKIVIIDPLMAHLDGHINSWRDQDIRSALAPLVDMAERLGVAVVVVRHLNKSGGAQSIYRGGGSIGIIGAARCGYLIAKDPENENRRIFASIKNNLAPLSPSLAFSIEGTDNSSRVVWGGISTHSADALLAIPSSPEERTALDEAKEFLRDILGSGGVNSREVQKQARQAGITEKTLQRAKKRLGVDSKKSQFEGGWVWVLLSEDGQNMPKMVNKNNDHLGEGMTIFGEEEPITVMEVVK